MKHIIAIWSILLSSFVAGAVMADETAEFVVDRVDSLRTEYHETKDAWRNHKTHVLEPAKTAWESRKGDLDLNNPNTKTPEGEPEFKKAYLEYYSAKMKSKQMLRRIINIEKEYVEAKESLDSLLKDIDSKNS